LPLTIHMPSIFGKLFFLVRNTYGRHVAWYHTLILHQQANLETKRNLKKQFQSEVLSRESFQFQRSMVPSSGIEVLSFHPL
jgi:hypothetical protein